MEKNVVLVARQPIFDRHIRVSAYEILFRASGEGHADFASADQATAEVSVRALLDIGLDYLVSDHRAWINLPRTVLVERVYQFLPPQAVVLELLETIEAEPEVIQAILEAKSLGYSIALDDFVLNERTAALLPYADFVKIDVLGRTAENLNQFAKSLRRPGLCLLAEKVETQEVFEHAVAAGCELFQGYFFARPRIVAGRRLPTDRLLLLQLVAKLQDQKTSLEQIEELVQSDVALTYRLLRYVNSAAVGTVAPIESIRHAVLMLGLARVRTCVVVLLLCENKEKPEELVNTALIRGRHCQLLGEAQGSDDPQRYFMVGLLSVLDAFLDQPLEQIVSVMGLAEDIADALISKGGELGAALEAVITCERADWDPHSLTTFGAQQLRDTYIESIAWATETKASLVG